MLKLLKSIATSALVVALFSVTPARQASGAVIFNFPPQAALGETIDVDVQIIVPGGGIMNGPIELSILIENNGELLVFCSGIIEMTEPGQINNTFSCEVPTDLSLGDHSLVIVTPFGEFPTPQELVLKVLGDHDVNGDGRLNIADVTAMIAFIFASGTPPLPGLSNGDFNCSGRTNIADVTALIKVIFADGSLPCWTGN